jgi:hypothetical protein
MLLLLCGTGILAFIAIEPPYEKIAIVLSTFGLLSILFGIHLLDDRDQFNPSLSRPWLRYIPLIIGISVDLLATWLPPIACAFALSVALAVVFPLSKMINVSKTYTAFLLVFLAGSIAYNVYYYYPLNLGIDKWGYLSVASGIIQEGHFSNVMQPRFFSQYFHPFPVMSIASSMLSSATGLDLVVALFVFPGVLVLLQPFLVFLLSRRVFCNSEAAALSAFVLVTESRVLSGINVPDAMYTAVSLSLLVLITLFLRPARRANTIVAFVLFLILVATHGAVALVSLILIAYLILTMRKSYSRMIPTFAVILCGYLTIAALLNEMVSRASLILKFLLTFTFQSSYLPELYSPGSNGMLFIWWGLPASLCLFSLLVRRRDQASVWAVAGVSLLVFSFIGNVLDPMVALDRYGGIPAWVILAVSGGKVLSTLARTRRRLLILTLVMVLVCFSAVINPVLSPQYGFAASLRLPTTNQDRVALDLVNRYVPNTTIVVSDMYSMAYLTFIRYRSGVLSYAGIYQYRVEGITAMTPKPNEVLLVRWGYTALAPAGVSCTGLVSTLANQNVNIIYNNSCDILETHS